MNKNINPIFSLVLILFSANLFAMTKVDLNLSGETLVDYQAYAIYKNNLECYPLGAPGNEKIGEGNEKFPYYIIGSTSLTKSLDANVNSNFDGTLHHSSSQQVVVDINEGLAEDSTVNISMTSKLMNGTGYPGIYKHGKCRKIHYSHAPRQVTVGGEISISYTVPNNVWLVKVSASGEQGLMFSENSANGSKGYFGVTTEDLNGNKYLWTSPGRVITLSFNMSPEAIGAGTVFNRSFIFNPIGGIYSSEQKALDDLKGLIFELRKLEEEVQNNEFNLGTDKVFEKVLSLNRNPKFLKNALSKLNNSELKLFSRQAYEFSNANYIGNRFAKELVYSLSLLSFNLGENFFEDIEKFCTTVEVDLPFIGKKEKVLGIKAAHLWMFRTQQWLIAFTFDEYRPLLEELSVQQKKGQTYVGVQKDRETIIKLKKAFYTLQKFGSVNNLPFALTLSEVNEILKVFDSISNNSSFMSELYASLNRGITMENEFYTEWHKMLNRFRSSSKDPVDVSDLLQRLESLNSHKDSVADLIKANVRFFDFAKTNTTQESMLRNLTEVIYNNISIFSEERPVLLQDGRVLRSEEEVQAFNDFRSQYILGHQISRLLDKANSCILGEEQ